MPINCIIRGEILSKKSLENNIIDKKISVKKLAKPKIVNKKVMDNSSLSIAQTAPKDQTALSTASFNSSSIISMKTNIGGLNLYEDVPREKAFILCDGRVILNCSELADLLVTLNDDIFNYHVTDNKNDFSNWINDIFLDSNLAKKISSIRNKIIMSLEIYKHMFELLKK
jgi:hypothetical protein